MAWVEVHCSAPRTIPEEPPANVHCQAPVGPAPATLEELINVSTSKTQVVKSKQPEAIQNHMSNHVIHTDNNQKREVAHSNGTAFAEVEGALMIARAAFKPMDEDPNQVPVAEKDVVRVVETHTSGWSYGTNLKRPDQPTGWFPTNVLVPIPAERHADALRNLEEAKRRRVALQRDEEERIRRAELEQKKREESEARQRAERARTQAQAASQAPDNNPHVCVAKYQSEDPAQLSLEVSQLVKVLDENPSGWTFGRLLDSSQREGWFPNWAVARRRQERPEDSDSGTSGDATKFAPGPLLADFSCKMADELQPQTLDFSLAMNPNAPTFLPLGSDGFAFNTNAPAFVPGSVGGSDVRKTEMLKRPSSGLRPRPLTQSETVRTLQGMLNPNTW